MGVRNIGIRLNFLLICDLFVRFKSEVSMGLADAQDMGNK